jgi:simple sugar transport system ATP-binding protein
MIRAFDIRTPGAEVPAGNLSGGNQQKVIIARELSRPIRLLIAAQPTRGLDVGSIEFIHSQIVAQRNQGRAVLLVSAELDEILALADRVGVMYRGKLAAVLPRVEATRERLGLLMAGGSAAAPEPAT